MPLRKFRSVADMNQPIWGQPGDPALYRTMGALWDTGRRLQTRRFTPGVYRFLDVGELESAADDRLPLPDSSGGTGA